MFGLRLKSLFLLLCLLAPAVSATHAEEGPASPPDSILFVGNSFTFYNNAIYSHLRKLLMAEDPSTRRSIFLKSMTISGGVLADHEGGLKQMLNLRPWHTIILQGHSLEAIDAQRSPGFSKALTDFSGLIRAQGARPVLFMTWAYADRPGMTPELDRAFTRLGDDLDMQVAPVGLAFANVLAEEPGIELHVADKLHPTLAGTYLAAAVFYASLYGKSPEPLNYDAGLDEASARLMRRVAWTTVNEYESRP